jgi:putative transposase
MPRFARLVVPEYPHHVTQRGGRRQQTFFDDGDYSAYLDILAERLPKAGVDVWAYCLMPNHVHLILVPHFDNGLTRLLRDTHATYARRINQMHGWQGHLWQERFHSFVMDEDHLLAAVRYVELNPVRAELCERPDEWPWSSVHFHLQRRADKLMTMGAMRDYVDDWHRYLDETLPDSDVAELRHHSGTGRPAGNRQFINKLEALTGRRLVRRKPGPRRHRKIESLSP